jgi:hypothetical protein
MLAPIGVLVPIGFEIDCPELAVGGTTIEATKYSVKGLLALIKVYSLLGILFTTDVPQILACALLLIAIHVINKNLSTIWPS